MLLALLATAVTCAAPQTPEWRLEGVLRIGALDDAEYALTRVDAIAVGPRNELFVSQPEELHIKVFDRTGRFVRRIGREGSAPGEFRSISGLYFAHDRLSVLDYMAGRMTRFSSDGGVVETFRAPAVPVEAPYFLRAPFAVGPDGTQYVLAGARSANGPADAFPLFVISPGGEARIIAHIREGSYSSRGQAGRLVMQHTLPIHGMSLFDVDHRTGDVILVDRPLPAGRAQSEWTLFRFRPNGETVLQRSFSYSPRPVRRGAAEAEMRRRVDDMVDHYERTRFPVSREEVEGVFRDGFRVPAYQAPVDMLVVGSAGEYWLRTGSFGEAVAEWIILDADARCIGRVRLPESTRVAFATDEHVGLVEADGLEVSYIAVARIHRN